MPARKNRATYDKTSDPFIFKKLPIRRLAAFSLYSAIAGSGWTDTLFFFLPMRSKTTTPSAFAKSVSSFPIPTFAPGWILVPLWRIRMLPAFTCCPPNLLTPSRLLMLSLPFFVLPVPFFWANNCNFIVNAKSIPPLHQ